MKRLTATHAAAALVAFLYLYTFPYFQQMGSANELPRVYLTRAMVDEHRVAIDTGVDGFRRQYHYNPGDVSPHAGHTYSNKAPGTSFLAVPAYLALKGVCGLLGTHPTVAAETWAFRVTTGVIPTLLFLLLLWRFLARYAPDPEARRLGLCGYAVGSMALIYSILFIAHQVSAVCIASAWILSVWVVEDGKSPRWLLAVGFLAGCAPLMDYQAAFAGVPVAAYLLWKLLGRRPRRWAGVALAVAGTIPPIALLLSYHWWAFGGPLRTGYAASETYARYHQQGFLGLDKLRWPAFVQATVAPNEGLVVLCPMLLLALPGFYLLWKRRERWTVGVTASVVVIYLLFISALDFWNADNWQVGPRYVTAMLPFALVPVVAALVAADRAEGRVGQALWAGAVALVSASILIYALSAVTFPHYPIPKFKNPVHELVLRLLGEGYAPYNAGFLVGLRGTWSLVPYFAAVAALLGLIAVPRRQRLRAGVVGLALGVLLVASYRVFPGGGQPASDAYHRITTWMPGGHRP